MKSSYVGIDLGTTFSAVATIDETGRPVIVHNHEGANITPSVVWVREDGTVEVGEEARKVWGVNPGQAAARFKRDMGSSTSTTISGREYTPTQLSAHVLRRLVDDAKATIGTVADAVVTIPANFAHEAREATLEAARSAGLNIRYIINEPTAAALYYAFKSGEALHGHYAVYDLGGGTFDVSIIRVDGQEVDVVASNGVARLGGADFDLSLQRLVQDKYKAQCGRELAERAYSKNDAESDKRSLSRRDRVAVQAGDHVIDVTRAEFEAAISTFVMQAEMLAEATLDEAELSVSQIRGVLLVGGSTRMPCIHQSVERVFKQKPVASANVDEVVALGAALYAAYKSDRTHLNALQSASVQKLKVSESTSKCFGTISVTEDKMRGVILRNSVLINKGERIPCAVTSTFYTVRDGQTSVDCQVTESTAPETDPNFVRVVWQGSLSLPPNRPEGQAIEVRFAYDDNQTMKCSFKDVTTGRVTEVDLSFADQAADSQRTSKFLVE